MKETFKKEPSLQNKRAVNIATKMGKRYTLLDAMLMGKKLKIDWKKSKFTMGDLLVGMHYELEHGKVDADTNVTNDNALKTAKIAWAHLKERPDYYVQLMKIDPPKKMEKKAGKCLPGILKEAKTRITKEIELGHVGPDSLDKVYSKTDIPNNIFARIESKAKRMSMGQRSSKNTASAYRKASKPDNLSRLPAASEAERAMKYFGNKNRKIVSAANKGSEQGVTILRATDKASSGRTVSTFDLKNGLHNYEIELPRKDAKAYPWSLKHFDRQERADTVHHEIGGELRSAFAYAKANAKMGNNYNNTPAEFSSHISPLVLDENLKITRRLDPRIYNVWLNKKKAIPSGAKDNSLNSISENDFMLATRTAKYPGLLNKDNKDSYFFMPTLQKRHQRTKALNNATVINRSDTRDNLKLNRLASYYYDKLK